MAERSNWRNSGVGPGKGSEYSTATITAKRPSGEKEPTSCFMRPEAGRPLNPHVGDPWCQQKLWLCPESDHLSPVQGAGGLFRGAVCPPLEMCPQQLDGHSAGSVQRSSPNRPWAGLGWGPRSSASLTPTARSRRVPHSCARCPVMRSAPRVGVSWGRCSAGARARAPSLFLGRAALFEFGGDQELRDNGAGSRARPGSGSWVPRPPAA